MFTFHVYWFQIKQKFHKEFSFFLPFWPFSRLLDNCVVLMVNWKGKINFISVFCFFCCCSASFAVQWISENFTTTIFLSCLDQIWKIHWTKKDDIKYSVQFSELPCSCLVYMGLTFGHTHKKKENRNNLLL